MIFLVEDKQIKLKINWRNWLMVNERNFLLKKIDQVENKMEKSVDDKPNKFLFE